MFGFLLIVGMIFVIAYLACMGFIFLREMAGKALGAVIEDVVDLVPAKAPQPAPKHVRKPDPTVEQTIEYRRILDEQGYNAAIDWAQAQGLLYENHNRDR